MKLKWSHYTSIKSVDLIYVMKDKDHIPNLLGRCKNSNKVFCVYTGLHFTHKHERPVSYKICTHTPHTPRKVFSILEITGKVPSCVSAK